MHAEYRTVRIVDHENYLQEQMVAIPLGYMRLDHTICRRERVWPVAVVSNAMLLVESYNGQSDFARN